MFLTDQLTSFAREPNKEFKTPLASQLFSEEQLDLLQRQSYFKFYLRPKFIIKTLLRSGSLKIMKNKFKAGVNLLKLAYKYMKK